MGVTVRIIKDTRLAGLAVLARRIKEGDRQVLVGVPEGKTEADGQPLAQVGAEVEFGTIKASERPFLRGGILSNLKAFHALNVENMRRVARGGFTVLVALGRLGAMAAGLVKEYMTGPHFVPNAPSTITKKGSSQPTIDTSQLMQSITWRVIDNSAAPAPSAGSDASGA